ncbi:MAG TPA: dihydrolipoyl dehydrogenase [Desulfuromonadales bacterium]|nr:dihydrolipoyl dehydrogenase [Desulfuromonadales bacterium]
MAEPSSFDLIVIGAGPGGYVAALRAAQLGMKVAVVEKRSTLGGVCLNEGCIPSKALLDSSELFSVARDRFSAHGIAIDPPRLELGGMMKRKDDVVAKLAAGIDHLFRKNGIERVHGLATLTGSDSGGRHRVSVIPAVSAPGGSTDPVEITSPKILLATGSEAVGLPSLPFDGQSVVTAREALSFNTPPDHLVIVGAGYIGLELGSVWRRLGSRVTVMEMLPQILPAMDRQIADTLFRLLRSQGIQFLLGARISSLRRIGSKTLIQYGLGNSIEELDCDRILVAAGRRPVTAGLGLEALGVRVDERGSVVVDDDYRTNVPGIYAIGDLVKGPMLAHKASAEGVACVERMAGKRSVVEYDYIPAVVYTWPEGASVGLTEEQLVSAGIPYLSGRANFAAIGRARCMDEHEGFVKILAHRETDRVLGVHIIGPRASDLIAEAATVMSFEGSARDIALMCHAHPTLSEALKEAALDVHKEAIHG